MTDEAQAPTAHEERLEQLGAAETRAERLRRAQLAGGAKIKAAVSLYDSMGDAADMALLTRQVCLKAWPKALKNLVSMATGEKKGCPASVQHAAIRDVAGVIGQSLEVAPGSDGSKPLAEMTLAELEQTLSGMSERVRDMQAIESTGTLLPQQGSTASDDAGAQAQPASE